MSALQTAGSSKTAVKKTKKNQKVFISFKLGPGKTEEISTFEVFYYLEKVV